MATLQWSLEIDRNGILRLDPLIDGEPLSSRFNSGSEPRVVGLVLGWRDLSGFVALEGVERLPLGSCECASPEVRVLATVARMGDVVRWTDISDVSSGTTIDDVEFDRSDYVQAFAELATLAPSFRRRYRRRIWSLGRDDGLPGNPSLVEGLIWVAMVPVFIFAAHASDTGDELGADFALWYLLLSAVVLCVWWFVRTRLAQRKYGGEVWVDGPLGVPPCPWHSGVRYLSEYCARNESLTPWAEFDQSGR